MGQTSAPLVNPYGAPSQPRFLPSLLGPVSVVTPPTGTIVSLDRAKKQCRVEDNADDDLIADLIDEAAEFCSRYIYGGATLLTTTYSVPVRCWWAWGQEVRLPYPPLQAVLSIVYRDFQGDTQTLPASYYEVLTPARQLGAIRRAPPTPSVPVLYPPVMALEKWPVTVTFRAGFGDATALPKLIRRAALLYIASAHRNRGDAAADPNALKAAQDCLDLAAGGGSY